MNILEQLGALFLQALPTIVLVYVFYFILKTYLFKPLLEILDERHRRMEGARKEAEAAQAAAAEKERAYQEAIKRARSEVYAEQEQARRAALEERAALVRETRNRSNERIREAKSRIAAELSAARAELERDSATLAAEIARAILQQRPPASPALRGGE